MTRPAIVIGLGGTGQWILTFLKKELLEIGNGQMPPGVKLLCFDTTSAVSVEAGFGAKKENQQAVRAGAVRLEEGTEFIPIGSNVGQLARDIADGQHSHLQWFPARSYLAKLNPAAFQTKEGSGQIRHMGRISLFQDLSAPNNSKVLAHLRQAFNQLKGTVSADRQMEIIIVGSLAGGTGAGMLVDLALLARAMAAREVQNNHIIRGFFVLPHAFGGGVAQAHDLYARAFAAWRELDRFMIVSDRFGLRQMVYHATDPDLQIQIDKRAYDVSYMIDPARQGSNSLDNVKAEEGLFPAVAHVLSAIIAGIRLGPEITAPYIQIYPNLDDESKALDMLRRAYVQKVTDPHAGMPAAELHVFLAEIHACAYEEKMPRLLGQDYRTLHPEVVALLEDRDHFEMFFRAFALGYIQKRKDEEQFTYWSYMLPGSSEEIFISTPHSSLRSQQEEDIFQVIHNFAIAGCDQRPGRGQYNQVDWDKLVKAILARERELGSEEAIKLYRSQIDDPNGLIQTIRRDVENRRSATTVESDKKMIGQEYEDLADLAKLIYILTVDAVKDRLSN